MSRSQPYRPRMPVEILRALDVASRITLFLVGQSGPLSFTFKDRLGNKYRTSIGAELKCSCSLNRNDQCIHTLYVLLKIFRMSTQNPLIWQAAYVDSELSDLLGGRHTILEKKRAVRPNFDDYSSVFNNELPSEIQETKQYKQFSYGEASAERLQLNQESVCPICQQEMKQDQMLSYCRAKCGNNFHLECIRVWAEHKSTTETSITCPMCRAVFDDNYIKSLQFEEKQFKKKQAEKIRIKFKCSGCGVDQIPKNVHKCVLCSSYELCEVCYKQGKHIKHPFIRQCEGDNLKWCGAEERREEELRMKKLIDNKRKEKNINEQLLQKLRKIQEDPSKLLDYVASAYPYVSKYISDNVDPYKKMDLDPSQMRCMKCCSTKMIFLRRLTCGHFIDHECLKQNILKDRFYCDACGGKVLKGYENLRMKEKQLNLQKQHMVEVSEQFNPRTMDRNKDEDSQNFVSEQATLTDLLGYRLGEDYQDPEEARVRRRIASNLVRGSEAISVFRNTSSQKIQQNHRSVQAPRERSTQRNPQNSQKPSMRIRNLPAIPKPAVEGPGSVSRSGRKQPKPSRQSVTAMIQAMIGRKIC